MTKKTSYLVVGGLLLFYAALGLFVALYANPQTSNYTEAFEFVVNPFEAYAFHLLGVGPSTLVSLAWPVSCLVIGTVLVLHGKA